MFAVLTNDEAPILKQKVFKLLCLTFPLALIFLLEGIFRSFGFGGVSQFFVETGEYEGHKVVITEPAGAASYFFANKHNPGGNNSFTFFEPKTPNRIRVFLAGASAIKGYPQPKGFASSAFLQAMLTDLWPSKTPEVINLGTTAIASFPVSEIGTKALDYHPDLMVIYCGHNEFFGAYGVASQHRATRSPAMMKLQRRIQSTATAQAINKFLQPATPDEEKSLMEGIMGQTVMVHDSPLRQRAAKNLQRNIHTLIRQCESKDVPVIVCTLPVNERHLAPLGSDPADLDSVSRLATIKTQPEDHHEASLEIVENTITKHPSSAAAWYKKGRLLTTLNRHAEALDCYQSAIDLDTMPWRTPTLSQSAITQAIAGTRAVLCDVQKAFRQASPGGAIGWELMDDHVHPSLQGQALIAQSILQTMSSLSGPPHVDPASLAQLQDWEHYAQRLGDNPYTRYGVAHDLTSLTSISFYTNSNPTAYQRFLSIKSEYLQAAPKELHQTMFHWQKKVTHGGGKRPISGMAARGLMRLNRFQEAEPLFQTALHSVPLFSSWNLEYSYFSIVCRLSKQKTLSSNDQDEAREAINRGLFLLAHGYSKSGMTERYVGRLYQMLNQYEEALPYLLVAQPKMFETDRVATDYAIIQSYVALNRFDEARTIAEKGIKYSGQYADTYRTMAAKIPTPNK